VLSPLPDGGFLRPGLEYLGRASQRTLGTLRVAGLSGVYSPRAFGRPRQRWPFSPEHARDASYYRQEELARLAHWPRPDILLLHEWPTQLEAARKPEWPRHWAKVGIEPLGELVDQLRPAFVFCGHMHCPAEVQTVHTHIVALDNFSSRPDQAVAILNGEAGDLQLEGRF
jgi:lariat debranching enzyme